MQRQVKTERDEEDERSQDRDDADVGSGNKQGVKWEKRREIDS